MITKMFATLEKAKPVPDKYKRLKLGGGQAHDRCSRGYLNKASSSVSSPD
jgi:hypothetical protein